MNDPIQVLITWTTYGTWLPGDERGWRHRSKGMQIPQTKLANWCKDRMNGTSVLLGRQDRETVELACKEHCQFRKWELLAVHARTNHVHVVVVGCEGPQLMRDQLKANCTRRLRSQLLPLKVEKTWTKGGDCQILDGPEALEAAITYVLEAQDGPK